MVICAEKWQNLAIFLKNGGNAWTRVDYNVVKMGTFAFRGCLWALFLPREALWGRFFCLLRVFEGGFAVFFVQMAAILRLSAAFADGWGAKKKKHSRSAVFFCEF